MLDVFRLFIHYFYYTIDFNLYIDMNLNDTNADTVNIIMIESKTVIIISRTGIRLVTNWERVMKIFVPFHF